MHVYTQVDKAASEKAAREAAKAEAEKAATLAEECKAKAKVCFG
jgi:hypothetical protein